MNTARIFRDVPADGAGDLARGVRGVIKTRALNRFADRQIAHTGLHDGGAIVVVDLENPIEFSRTHDHRITQRQRAAGERSAGAARDHADLVLLAPFQNCGDLVRAFGQHHDQGQLMVGAQSVALIGTQRVGMVDDAIGGHDRTQRRHDGGSLAESALLRFWHQ